MSRITAGPDADLVAFFLFALTLSVASKTDLLVEGAVDSGARALLAALQGRKQIRIAEWTFWTGRVGRNKASLREPAWGRSTRVVGERTTD